MTPSIATGRYGNSNLNTIVIAQFHKYDNSIICIVKPPYELFLGHLVLVDSLQGVINLLVGGVEAVAVILGRPHVRGGQLWPGLPLGLPDPLPGPVGGHPQPGPGALSH